MPPPLIEVPKASVKAEAVVAEETYSLEDFAVESSKESVEEVIEDFYD